MLVLTSPTFDLQALLVKRFLGFFGDLLIGRAEERGQSFEHGHLCADTTPDRTHFQTNHTRANDGQLFGHRTDAQGTVVGEHIFFVKRCAGQCARIRASGHDDLLANQGLVVFACDLDFKTTVCGFDE